MSETTQTINSAMSQRSNNTSTGNSKSQAPLQGEDAPSAYEEAATAAATATSSDVSVSEKKAVSLTLAKKKKKKKSAAKPGSSSESVRKALDQEPSTNNKDSEYYNDESNKEPLVIPVIADKIRFPTTATENEAEESIAEEPSSSDICQAKGTTAEDEEAIQALQSHSTSGGSQSRDSNKSGNKISISTSSNTFNHQERRETQQFKTDLEEYPEQIPLDSEQYQRVPIADFGAALLRGMGWSGEDNGGGNNNKKTKDINDDAVMPRPHRLGLGAIPKADTTTEMPPTSSKRRGLRPDQLQQKQRLKQQQDDYQRQREQQVAQDKQRTMQNGSLVLMRVPSPSSSKVKLEEKTRQQQQQQRYRACILQLVGVPGLNMVRVQYENELEESIVKRGDIERLLTRDELQQEPFQKAEPSSSVNDRDDSKRQRPKYDNNKRRIKEEEQSHDDRRRQESSKRESSRGDQSRRGGHSERDDDYYDKRSSSKKRRRDNKDDYNSYSDEDSRRDRKKKRDSDRGSSRRDRDERRSASGSSDRRRRESKEKETFHWATPHIRVRIITEKLGRRYFKEKAVVLDVTHKGLTLQLSPSGGSGSNVVLDRVPERYLETALPKAGGCVLVLQGDHRGTKGRLLERDSKRAVGILQTAEDLEVLTLPLDDMAEWMGSLDDE